MKARPQLAISRDFLGAFAVLPRPQQRKVDALITKFTTDPTSPGLNYEPVDAADNMRSLRIDGSYRAIVLKPERGNLYLMLWADKHDEAYKWAARHHCRVHPDTGTLQVYQPQEIIAAPGAPAGDRSRAHDAVEAAITRGPFAVLRKRQLRRLGVPEAMLAEIRALSEEESLRDMRMRLPTEVYESLLAYLTGDSYEDVVRARETPAANVDTEDIVGALDRLESRARFVIVESESELSDILNAPLEEWRVFLHPTQRRLVERTWNGPVRVLGGAGTGKTVVAMHRARWLARNLPDGGQVLFVTFTRNLAADIENNLRSICSRNEMRRIEVTNLDRWVHDYLRQRDYGFRIVYDRANPPWNESWRQALALVDPLLDLPSAFYADEFDQVVLANGITTEADYLRIPRIGRGTSLRRFQRTRVWPVFEKYRRNLLQRGAKEMDDAYRDAAMMLTADRSDLPYAAAVVDEAQDLGAQAYRLIRALIPRGPDDIFIVGDGHQRIFGRNRVVLERCGIRVVGRSRKLRLNYRTTEETRSWAVRLLDEREVDDLDGGHDDNQSYKSLTQGPAPRIITVASPERQAAFIIRWLRELLKRGENLRDTCVVARTKAERDAVATAIRNDHLPAVTLEKNVLNDADGDAVRVATMHRVKGLEFDHVIMASVNEGLVPLTQAMKGHADENAREAAETEERALVYVAATRARRQVLVLCHGRVSPFVDDGRESQSDQ